MKPIKSILCVLVDGPGSDEVMKRAVSLAQNNQASLTAIMIAPRNRLFGVFGEKAPNADRIVDSIRSGLGEKLQQLVKSFAAGVEIETRILAGTPFLQIIREVLRNHHDLVIKLPDDEEFIDGPFGSDDMHLLRKCPCPVWLALPQKRKTYRKILAAVDIDDSYPPPEMKSRLSLNRAIIDFASSMAVAEFAELHIVHAWTAMGEEVMRGNFLNTSDDQVREYVDEVRNVRQRALQDLIEGISDKQARQALDYLKPKLHLVKGRARREIPILTRKLDADLLVIGTVARTGIPGLIMGNTAESVLRQIQCSVLAIKPPGFVSPVRLEDEK